MSVSLTPARYPDSARVGAYTDAMVLRLERIPGVVAASSTTALPAEFPIDFPVSVVGRSDEPKASGGLRTWMRGTRHQSSLLCGDAHPTRRREELSDSDGASGAPVVVINQALARAAFPNDDALGAALVIGRGYLTDARDLRPGTIVGIVGDTRERGCGSRRR